jgi:hypothetical protein
MKGGHPPQLSPGARHARVRSNARPIQGWAREAAQGPDTKRPAHKDTGGAR